MQVFEDLGQVSHTWQDQWSYPGLQHLLIKQRLTTKSELEQSCSKNN